MATTISPTQTDVVKAVGDFLSAILPLNPGDIRQGQVNRVSPPSDTDYVIITPMGAPRMGTNFDSYLDSMFTASITGTVMTVTAVNPQFGPIVAGNQVFGIDVAANTKIIQQTGGIPGGNGTYTVSVSQNVGSETMAAGIETLLQPVEAHIQLDIFGPNSWNNADIVSTVFRDERGVLLFASGDPPVSGAITPLYVEDPRQMPFIDENQQYEDRWVVELHLEVNQTLNLPQEFASALDMTTIANADNYPA